MPELPEVQTVVNHLRTALIGKVFVGAILKDAKVSQKNLSALVKGQKIQDIERLGKMIVFKFKGDKFLVAHLKMTGQLIYVDPKRKNIEGGLVSPNPSAGGVGGGHPIKLKDFIADRENKFTRLVLNLKGGGKLLFHDVRKFGWVRFMTDKDLSKLSLKLGLDPIIGDFSYANFKKLFTRSRGAKIKQWLLNQSLISGLGNIYVDESLFASGISPLRPAGTLSETEFKKLHKAIKLKLKQAIKHGGTSFNTFMGLSGERGAFVDRLQVYGRGKQKCLKCGNVLTKIKLAGRGTVFCQRCQM